MGSDPDQKLQSMTGYASAEGRSGDAGWQWQIRAVNGKGLDIRLRLPSGFEAIEQDVRKCIAGRIKRGNLQVTLTVDRDNAVAVPTVNEAALEAVLAAAEKLAARLDAPKPTVEGILSLRGVLETVEPSSSGEIGDELVREVMQGLDEAVSALRKSRGGEGAALGKILNQNLDQIEKLTTQAEENPARSAESIRARLSDQVALLLEASNTFDRDRLLQEVALLATKADIREELDRLYAHVEAARELLASEPPVGRKLEFLAQEFNRESNTLCSKSNARELTAIGLELKVVIDQFREQILNLE